MGIIAADIIEFEKVKQSFDKSLGVHANGDYYPQKVERIIAASPTAQRCTNEFRKTLIGRAFAGELNEFIVNSDGTNLRKFLRKICISYAIHRGAFIHINYNANYNIYSAKVLPYSHCLVGKKDDNDWAGKVCVYDNWAGDNGSFDKKKISVIDVFNPKKEVIKAQITKAGGIDKYKGQILFFNPDETTYPLAKLHSVLDDADSERQSSIFKNKSLRKGFFGKKVAITPPMIDGDLRYEAKLSDEQLSLRSRQISERDNFRGTIKSFLGVDNIDGVMHLEMELEGDDIEKTIKFIDIQTNINDKLFAHTEESVTQNIVAASGVPAILVRPSDSSIFGNSGELLKQARIYYQSQCEEDISNIENEILMPIMREFEGFSMPQGGLKIQPLILNEIS
ncbi:MAG: hypothetical protein KDD49_03815 [Bacteroidetes bacterium]|nr:hypothetical protein [Bacteroidota bacterium]